MSSKALQRNGAAVLAAVVIGVFSLPGPASTNIRGIRAPFTDSGDGLEALLDGIASRVRACSAYKTWSAAVSQKITEADDSWAPRRVTLVTKTIRMNGKVQEDRILKAEVIEDGRTVDITAQFAADRRVFLEKEKKRLAEREAAGENGENDPDRKHYFDLAEILPFGPDRRSSFEFLPGPAGDAGGDGRAGADASLVLMVRPKVAAPGRWDGVYTVNPRTFDVQTAEVRPSQNPRFVKEIVLKVEIGVLDQRYYVLKRTHLNAGFLVKRIHKIIDEEYSDVRILD